MSSANGHAAHTNGSASARTSPTPRDELRNLRTENRLRVERVRSERLRQAELRATRRREVMEALSLDWVTPYAELLDMTRRAGDPVITGPSSAWQRRHGRNWPIYQTEAELNLLRAPARLLLATTGSAQGLVEGITSYLVGSGCTYRMAKAKDRDELPVEVVEAAQDVVDEILDRNQWFGGEQPGIEEELVGRSMEDGEFVLCHYPGKDGWTEFRVQEPEQLTQPPGSGPEYLFGILTPKNDTQKHERYYIQFGDSPDQGEEYDADEVTHFRRNVRRSMKRGVTDFCFDTYDALSLAGKLRTNLADTAAQQASIVAVRQHESGTKEDLQAFVDDDADLTERDYLTGGQTPVKQRRRGSWEDIPKGMSYVPGPIASSTPIHIQVLDACLRGAGCRWQAPPWLMSGDLNAMNYATSLTAESPFVKTILRRQRPYCEAFRRPVWFALEHYARTHGLRDRTGRVWSWDEVKHRLKLQVTAPSPETRDKLAEAQRASVEIPLGVQSRQGYMQEQGRDVDRVEADNQAYQDKFGGDGQQLPDGSGDGSAGARTDGGDGLAGLTESLLESEEAEEVGRVLLEAAGRAGLVQKVITDKNGKKSKRWVKAGNDAKKEPESKEKEPSHAEREHAQAKADHAAKVTEAKETRAAADRAAAAYKAEKNSRRPDRDKLDDLFRNLRYFEGEASKAESAAKAAGEKLAAMGGGASPPPPPPPVPTEKPAPAKKADPKAARATAKAAAVKALEAPHTLDQAGFDALSGHLAKLTIADHRELAKSLGAKGGKSKTELAKRILEAAKAQAAKTAAAAPVSTPAKSGEKLDKQSGPSGNQTARVRPMVAHYGSPTEMARPEHIELRSEARAALAQSGFGPGKTTSEKDLVKAAAGNPVFGKIAVAQLEKLGEIERVPGTNPEAPEYRVGPNWGKPEPKQAAPAKAAGEANGSLWSRVRGLLGMGVKESEGDPNEDLAGAFTQALLGTLAEGDFEGYTALQQLVAGGGDEKERQESRIVLEGFTGEITDSAGRKRHYVDGKQVAAPEEPAGGDKGGGAKPAAPQRNDAKPPADLENAKLVGNPHPNVEIRSTPEGDWVVKGRNGKLAGVQNESLASGLAADLGLNVPRVHAIKKYGQDAAAVALVPGQALVRMTADERKAALAKVPKAELDSHALFDYLIANRDPNAGNYMIGEGGEFVAIDKELTLHYGGEGDKARYTPPAYIADAPGSEKGPGAYEFDKQHVADMIEKGGEVVKKLEAAGLGRSARGVARRVEVLKQLAASGQPVTTAAIDAAGAKLDKASPAKVGIRDRLKSLFGWSQ